MSVRRESQNRTTGISSDLTVFLTLRYHYKHNVTSENHCFDLGIGKLSENKDRKILVIFSLNRQLVVKNRVVKYFFISHYSLTLRQHYEDGVIG